ncbi:hypothetical protein MACH17_06160 [Phaeobacter inhibens]|uniref:DUF2652 domain-containing protein n=1 Tax=Phaeobacter inhibens TaxID=221822 RepID=UPI00277037F3|nr:DUF2652 domain-containing protein [Phaeobacter inhibens]GLO69099.1 hypothetical protein MACH17_06160 [Phaeobacter inhibens]
MRSFQAVLVVADISGYTRFIMLHRASIAHAEVIISELLESVTETASTPLKLQKLEGDSAFMYAEISGSEKDAVADVMRQVRDFIAAFDKKKRQLFEKSIGGCIRSACQSIEVLDLKVIVHIGDVLEKKVSGSTELAGEAVIVAHRLLKNSLSGDRYVLATIDVASLLDEAPFESARQIVEPIKDMGDFLLTAYLPDGENLDRQGVRPLTRPSSYLEILRLFAASAGAKLRPRQRPFEHLPR